MLVKPAIASEYEDALEGHPIFEQLEAAKLRRQRALAERMEIEVLARRAELIPLAHVRKWMRKFLVEGRDMLMHGPSELQDALAAESDPLKCEAILRNWVEGAIAKLHSLNMRGKDDN